MDYHGLVSRIFQVTLSSEDSAKNVVYLSDLAEELEQEGTPRTFTPELLERVLCSKLASINADPALQMTYLFNRFRKLDDLQNSTMKFATDVSAAIPGTVSLVISYMLLTLTCPELFITTMLDEAPQRPYGWEGALVASLTFDAERPNIKLLSKFADRVSEEGPEVLKQLFEPMLIKLVASIQGRNSVDLKHADLGYLASICTSKCSLVSLLVSLNTFLPAPPVLPGVAPSGVRAGYLLQTESLLGHVLAPTPLDSALWNEKSAKQLHFGPNVLMSHPQILLGRPSSGVIASMKQLRTMIRQTIESSVSICQALLRMKGEPHAKVMDWFASVLHGTEPRTKGIYQIHEGGDVEHFVESMTNSPMPFHQNLDMRLSIQLMNARMQGFPTSGFSLNVAMTLMELCLPIKLSAVTSLDAYFIDHPVGVKMLRAFTEETRLADEDQLIEAKEYGKATYDVAPKFTTQLFWLTLKAMYTIVLPAIKEDMCFMMGLAVFVRQDQTKAGQCFGEHMCHETIFGGPEWSGPLIHFTNMLICFLLCHAYPDHGKNLASGLTPDKAFANIVVPPERVEPTWAILPGCILDIFVGIFEYYTKSTNPNETCPFFQGVDATLVLLCLTFLLGSGDHVKNPTLRGKLNKIFIRLSQQQNYRNMLDENPTLIRNVVPSCIRVFSAVEKTKRSYYDIRMHLKYQLRAPIMNLFRTLVVVDSHRKALRDFAQENSDEFIKFLNHLMNDLTVQLDEGLDTLAEIRRRARCESDPNPTAGSGTSGLGVNREQDEDDVNDEGEDIYRRSRSDPAEHCKTYMKLGSSTMETLWTMAKEAPQVIVNNNIVLQQMLHNCLNSCLDRLVGPKCLELKGTSRDFDQYNFNPRELLCWIGELYVYLRRVDKEKVLRMIVEDGRSYKHQTFHKATVILGRENLMSQELLEEFKEFVQACRERAEQQNEALAAVDIPDEFLDPIISDIMGDPVLLPSSNTIMDRQVIERHILSSDQDPFNRMPLKITDLIPQLELRQRIQAFCRENNIIIDIPME